jgi:hypothetical protein
LQPKVISVVTKLLPQHHTRPQILTLLIGSEYFPLKFFAGTVPYLLPPVKQYFQRFNKLTASSKGFGFSVLIKEIPQAMFYF